MIHDYNQNFNNNQVRNILSTITAHKQRTQVHLQTISKKIIYNLMFLKLVYIYKKKEISIRRMSLLAFFITYFKYLMKIFGTS